MKIEIWPLNRIIPYDKNARKIPQSAIDSVARSLKEFGPRQPIVVEPSGVIVVGHVRRLGALQNGAKDFPVHVADNLTPAQLKAYRLMDNRSHEEATWEPELLKAEMLELRTLDLDLGLTGFSSRELDAILRPALEGEDDAPPLPEKAFTQPGDLWTMGDHRLLCGDATDASSMFIVIGDGKVSLVLTDPPYGVGVDYASFSDSQENVKALMDKVMPLLLVWSPVMLTSGIPAMWGYPKPDWLLAWVHPAPVGGCPWGFGGLNPIMVWGKDPYLQKGLGRRPDVLVLAADRKGVEGHPTPKPLEVWKWLMDRGTTASGDLVLDPFMGSGTGIIAAQLLNRRCVGLELNPAYCDVAVQRWQNLTGKQAYNQDGVCFPNV